ncbi:tripartite tricarboxylate transporter TctB family protein [Jiangella asiatica]|uniref:tripartite tricarboxylate transporter TctB family protein n=1 Tax=Jiangella asiatica TaxID=2530372 RepID=UPI0013A5C807|nr:tripartite tricarboxylate transporter TctB family protein [Jiangella asiatica]
MTDAEVIGHRDGEVDPAPSPRFVRACFAVLFAAAAGLTVSVRLTMPVGSIANTEPGFWPFWVALLTTLLLGFAQVRPAILLDRAEAITGAEARGLALALPVLLLAVPALGQLGVATTTAFVTLYWCKAVVGSSWRTSVVTAAAASAGILVIFLYLLDVPFPAGTLTGF